MKKVLIFVIVGMFFLPTVIFAGDSQDLFVRKGCNKCHSLDKFKIERTKPGEDQGPDLSDVGKTYDAEWMTKWLRKKVKKENKDGEMKKHSNTWKGGASQLDKLVQFLAGLK